LWPEGTEGAPTRGDETEQAWAVPGGKDLRAREGKKGTRSRGHTNNDGGTGRGLWTRGDIKDTNCWLEGWGHWRDADPRILDVCEGRLSIGSGRRALPLPGVRHGVGRGGRDVPRPQRCSWVEATAGLRGRRDGVGGERRKEGPQRGDDTQ